MRLNTFIFDNCAAITAEPIPGLSERARLPFQARSCSPAASPQSSHPGIASFFQRCERITYTLRSRQQPVPMPLISTNCTKQNPLQSGPVPAV